MTFEQLFNQYYTYVVKQLVWLTKNQTVAEELAQDVFLQLYRSDWRAIEHVPGWLIATATNIAYNYMRGEKRHRARVEQVKQHYEQQYEPSAEERALREENIANVQTILHELDERDRTVLLMKFSGYAYKDIAAAIEVEVTSVGTLIVRALQKFRKRYGEEWR